MRIFLGLAVSETNVVRAELCNTMSPLHTCDTHIHWHGDTLAENLDYEPAGRGIPQRLHSVRKL